MCIGSDRRGFVLIFTLWVLGFLSILALAVGLGSRQKIALLERLEDRSRVRLAVEAGAKKAMALLVDDLENSQLVMTVQAKSRRHNNHSELAGIAVGEYSFDVVYDTVDERSGMVGERFGLADEQSKLNLNTVDRDTLARLLSDVLSMGVQDAKSQAEAIIDWRDFGKHEAEGFFSDDYYKNLEYPYEMKEQNFERIDELLLVKGIDSDKYARLLPYLTVWGDGRVNVNTVSGRVLEALGLEAAVTEKLLKVRRGQDALESTADDHIFFRTFDIAAEVKAVIPLEERELRQIDALNTRNVLSTNSFLYSGRSRVALPEGRGVGAEVWFVLDALANKIVYWYEK
ncbi:MAG: general secretion pathway protein GspK [Candidatus Omnitrophica bacterium]|nr:general secretion pathway protein GspK [Candidatus Omnitrophota bacterium]